MEFRSTNTLGFVHFQGDIVSNVSSNGPGPSSHGVQLTGGATGGVVQPAGDETNIALNVRSKGTGPCNVGASTSGQLNLASSMIDVQSTRMQLGDASTSGLIMAQRYVVQIDTAAMVLAASASADTVVSIADLTTNVSFAINQHATWSTRYDFSVMCSTAAELRVRLTNRAASTFGSGESSNRLTVTAFMFQ